MRNPAVSAPSLVILIAEDHPTPPPSSCFPASTLSLPGIGGPDLATAPRLVQAAPDEHLA
jgi:hypothetical protein